MEERIWVCVGCRAEYKQDEIFLDSKGRFMPFKKCPNCGAFSWMPKELLERVKENESSCIYKGR
jgi:hypothetical protein